LGDQDNDISPAGQIELAERLLIECDTAPGRITGPWSQDRIEVRKNDTPHLFLADIVIVVYRENGSDLP